MGLINTDKYSVILASSSPRRAEIIHDHMGIKNYTVMVPKFKEDLDKTNYQDDPTRYVHDTCHQKAAGVLEELARENAVSSSPYLVICADTIVVGPDNKIFEKPGTKKFQMLYLGRFCREYKQEEPVRVITSVAVIKFSGGEVRKRAQFEEVTNVYFDHSIPTSVIEDYVESEDGLNVAGGFKIQGPSGVLIRKIDGDYYNVVGLPLNRTFTELLKMAK